MPGGGATVSDRAARALMIAALWMLAALLVLVPVLPAHAARTFVSGWETGDEREFDDGGTTANTTITTDARTGGLALQVAAPTGSTAYHERDLAPQDLDVYARVAAKLATAATSGRAFFGFWQSSTATFGCRLDVETDGSVTVRFKNRTNYQELGSTDTATLSSAGYRSLELHQKNDSGTSCAGDCQVTCELWLDGTLVVSQPMTNILAADYGAVTNVRVGAGVAETGTYTMRFDDFASDDAAQIGVGRVVALTPNGDGTPNQWNNTCGGSKAGCVDDYVTGPDDGATSDLRETSSGNKTTLTMTTVTLASGETVQSVSAFGIAREVTDDTRNWRLNLTDGDGGSDGSPTINPAAYSSPGATYALSGRIISSVKPGGGAWTQSAVDSLTVQLEHGPNTGNIDVTAVLAYVDVQEQAPAIAQNLQDWDGDGRITIATMGDSVTEGTGLGSCQGDASVQCSTNLDCQPPATGSDVSPCANTAKYPSILASLVTQKLTKGTTVLNCGINGNTSHDLIDRAPGVLTGVGASSQRYCIGQMPKGCTPTGGCTSTSCASSDCNLAPNFSAAPPCHVNCILVLGSRVCSGSRSKDCVTNADCTGGEGTCTDFPAADYVVPLVGANDANLPVDPNCFTGMGNALFGGSVAPCPPMHTAHPNATPTPGAPYVCERVSCNNTTECRTGLCSNDTSKACDGAGDCGGNACSTSLALGIGLESCVGTCTIDTARPCTTSANCIAPDTCNTASKACSCSCYRIPCATNADCGGASRLHSANGRDYDAGLSGVCSGGKCSECGSPGAPVNANYGAAKALRDGRPGGSLRANYDRLTSLVNAAGRRIVWLTTTGMNAFCDSVAGGFGFGCSLPSMLQARAHLLTQPNVVDVWLHWKHADKLIQPQRCNNNASQVCVTNADCSGSGAQCVTMPSTLRPAADSVHPNQLGATQAMARPLAAYLGQLSPVCSGDPTTGCGRCSTNTGTACTKSSECPAFTTGEKCVKTDSVCSGAGKGTCSLERTCYSASNCTSTGLCTLDLATKCLTNGDCTGKGVCRAGGVLAPGEG